MRKQTLTKISEFKVSHGQAANAQTIDSFASGYTTHTSLAVYSQL